MLLEALAGYRTEKLAAKRPGVFSRQPYHSWESHYADALRYLFVYRHGDIGSGDGALEAEHDRERSRGGMEGEAMICESCAATSTTSRVYAREVRFANPEVPPVVFYDPSGKYHIHDTNISQQRHECDGPHHRQWWFNTWRPCPEPTCASVPITYSRYRSKREKGKAQNESESEAARARARASTRLARH